jgi:hypothetical protein
MGRGRTVTLKGAAAGAFVEAMRGKKPASEEDKYLRLATFIHMNMSTKQEEKAILILKSLKENGLDFTVRLLSS